MIKRLKFDFILDTFLYQNFYEILEKMQLALSLNY